jgi:hypothetical protein
LKNLQGCLIYFVGGVILAVAITGAMYVHEMSPTWNDIARRQAEFDMQIAKANAMTDIQAHEQRSMAINTGSWVLVALLLGTGVVMWWKEYDKRHESKRRAVDGTFALQTFSANGFTYHVDPNKALFGVVGFNQGTGEIITDAQMTGPDRQLEYAVNVQKTRTVAAKQLTAGKPSRNELLAESGFFDNKARAEDAKAKLAEMRLLAHETPALDDGDPKALPDNWQPLTLVDAFRQSTPDRWLLGQNDEGVCEFSIKDNIHTGLLGATGTGKTASTALLMAYDALRSGMHVIALDGKGGVDWTQHERYLEAWPTDYTMIPDQIAEIVRLHDLRMKEIKRAKVENISQLDYQIPPLFVIMEEFGYTMQALKAASSKRHEQTENALSNLMRVSRATGIHFLLIDQSAKNWPGTIKANVKAWFAYQLKGLQGNAFNAYDLHLLKPKGQFWHNDNVYNAWFTKSEAKTLQQELRPIRTKLLTNVEYSVTGADDDSGYELGGESNAENTPIKTAPVTPVTAPVTSGYTQEKRPVTAPVTGTLKPLLTGAPVTVQDKNEVRKIYAVTGSKSETCRIIWGGKNGQRLQWVNDVLKESDVFQ